MAAGSNNQDVKLNFVAETKAAARDLRELERQVQKLGDLGMQGKHRQDGFLSPKQVQMYKDIVRQIKAVQDDYLRQLDRVNKEVDKRQSQYNSAQIRGATVPARFYQSKLAQAQAQQSFLQGVVPSVNQQASIMTNYGNQIGSMHQLGPQGRKLLYGAGHALQSTGMIMSVRGLSSYLAGGVRMTTAGEQDVSRLGMKVGTYGGDFGNTLSDIQKAGILNGYKSGDTNDTAMSYISQAGTSGNQNKLLGDVKSIQGFSRAYGMDSSSVASAFGTMSQMGATNEGGQRRFADLIAGSISKAKMNGREEEALRSTISLASQVGSTMTKFSEKQLDTVVGYQTMLAQAIPTLKGDKGAQLLGNVDSAIKSGGNNMDILMGKGTKYVGTAGMWQLQLQKEKGISDPANLRTILTTLSSGIKNPQLQKFAMMENLNLTATQVEDLYSSGVVDKILSGQSVTKDQIDSILKTGEQEQSSRTSDYDSSSVYKNQRADAVLDKTKTDAGRPIQRGITELKDMFTHIPESGQLAGIAGMAMGAGALSRFAGRGLTSLYKTVMPNIAGRGAAPTAANAARQLVSGGTRGAASILRNPSVWRGLGTGLLEGGAMAVGGYAWDQYMSGDAGNGQTREEMLQSAPSRISKAISTVPEDEKGMGYFQFMGHELKNGVRSLYPSHVWDTLRGKEHKSNTHVVDDDGESIETRYTSTRRSQPTSQSYENLMSPLLKPIEVKHLVTIEVKGGIDGMNASNQDAVKNDFHNYFSGVFSSVARSNGINLSVDQSRR